MILGGLTGNDYPFLEQLYAAGAKGAFDAVSVHTDTACGIASPYDYYRAPDGRVSQYSFLGYQEVLKSMAAAGDGDKKLWMTEMGWSSSGAPCDQGVWAGQKAGGVSEDTQALFLRQAWHCVAGDPRVAGVFWFNLTDLGADDQPDHRFGLLRFDGSEKPAFAALADVAAGNDRLPGPVRRLHRTVDPGAQARRQGHDAAATPASCASRSPPPTRRAWRASRSSSTAARSGCSARRARSWSATARLPQAAALKPGATR